MSNMVTSYILLGSNMGDRANYLNQATELIAKDIGSVVHKSCIYESEPWGYNDATSYYNRLLQIESNYAAQNLLKACLSIEDELGRVRNSDQYEARTIDIDVLFFGDEVINTVDLIVPHPRIKERRFVLEPLNEIAPELMHPVLSKKVKELLKVCTDTSWVKRL